MIFPVQLQYPNYIFIFLLKFRTVILQLVESRHTLQKRFIRHQKELIMIIRNLFFCRGKVSVNTLAAALVVFFLLVLFRAGSKELSDPQYNTGEQITRSESTGTDQTSVFYRFRTKKHLTDHFAKHGNEFNYADENEYLYHANLVISNTSDMKSKQPDGDTQYLNSKTCEYVTLSYDNYIRTYFRPRNCVRYFNRNKSN